MTRAAFIALLYILLSFSVYLTRIIEKVQYPMILGPGPGSPEVELLLTLVTTAGKFNKDTIFLNFLVSMSVGMMDFIQFELQICCFCFSTCWLLR